MTPEEADNIANAVRSERREEFRRQLIVAAFGAFLKQGSGPRYCAQIAIEAADILLEELDGQ